MWLATKRWTKRYWWAWLIAAIVVVIVATYNVWMPMVRHWQMEQKDATPVVAADTLPEPVKTEVDTMANVLSHEDSLRIQDSIRHARWLYWKSISKLKRLRKMQRKQLKKRVLQIMALILRLLQLMNMYLFTLMTLLIID